jgi:hypothetical protein
MDRQEYNFALYGTGIARLIQAAEVVLETETRTTLPLTIIRRKAA